MIYAILIRYLFDPVAWVLYLLVAALIAGHYHQQGLQRGLIAGAAIFLLALMILPLGEILARPLENQYPRGSLPAHVDGIVILDGGLNAGIFATRGVTGENNSTLRLIAGADLGRRFPNAKLIFSGTSSSDPTRQKVEHEAAANLLGRLGIAPERMLYERTSRDTGQNLANSMALARPKPGETWMLVTSAVHMPRAMAIADKLGWKMLPWPSDYISTRGPHGGLKLAYPSDGLLNIDRALHEWIGLIVYRLGNRAK
jgi:uncharacterized SAM-binding protein YcdF (DUF218 family)